MRPCLPWRVLALAGHLGLLGWLLLWFTWLAPPRHTPVAVALLGFAGPLLLPLRGLLHGRAYTHAWTSLLSLLYFTHGVVLAWAEPGERTWALVEVALSLVLFTGAAWYARCRARQAGITAPAGGGRRES